MPQGFRFDLSVPAPFLGLDPFKVLLGIDLDSVLESLLAGAIVRTPAGQKVYPLVLPEGEPLHLSLRQWGAIGLGCSDSALHVWLPPALQADWEAKVQASHRPHPPVSTRILGSPCLCYRMAIPPGASATLSLGPVGALGIRVPPEGGGLVRTGPR